nr:ABC transporter permease [Acidobacteriota bacterium]
MMWIARLLVQLSALLVPTAQRDRWREEWLGELHSAPASRATARRALGAPRDAWSTRAMHAADRRTPAGQSGWSAWSTDLKYAWRQLIRRPGYTLAVIACLGVGLAASVGTFSFLMSLLYGDLAGLSDRRSIARVYLSYDSATSQERVADGRQVIAEPLSLSDLAVLRHVPSNAAISALSGEGPLRMTAAGLHGPVSLAGAFVTGDFFITTRTAPQLGRLLRPADEQPDAAPAVVVADYFWRTHLDARPDAIGAPILVGGQSFVVVGVTPARFHGTQPLEPGRSEALGVQLWLPLQHATIWPNRPADDEPWLQGIARLQPNRTIAEVNAMLNVTAAGLSTTNPAKRANASAVVRSTGFGAANQPTFLIFILALVMSLPLAVLAIGCANVANLQLARAAERARELAVRLSLGATRAQLVRLLTLETLARTTVAVVLSLVAVSAALSYAQPLVPMTLTIDWRASAFALVLAVGVSVATGLMPAWMVLRRSAAGQLKQNAQGGGLGHARLRASLVVAQFALSLALLSVTAVFLRTAQSMEASAPPALMQQLVADFDSAELRLTPLAARQMADAVSARLSADSRVAGVAVTQQRAGRVGAVAAPRANDRVVAQVEITPSWFALMDLRMLAGRGLTAQDAPDVAVISAALADQIAPQGSALGQTLQVEDGSGPRRVQIVGVVDDFASRPMMARPDPVLYAPLRQTLTGAFT